MLKELLLQEMELIKLDDYNYVNELANDLAAGCGGGCNGCIFIN